MNFRYFEGIPVWAYARVLSHVQLFVILWIVACQAPLFMEFPSQDPAGESKIIDIA